jgi:O-antigen/teichoic acid export membrane protein
MLGSLSKLKRGALFGAALRMATGMCTILIGACLARILSVEALGLFFLFSRLVRLVGMIVAFGMPNGLQKIVGIAAGAGDWTGMRVALRHAGRLLVLATVAAAVVYAVAWPFLAERLFGGAFAPAIAVVIFAVIFLRAIERVGSAFFRAVRQYALGVFLLGFPREAGLVAIFGLMLLAGVHADIDTVLLIYLAVAVAVGLATALAIGRFVSRRSGGDGTSVDPSFKAFGVLCIPLMVTQVVADLYTRFDIWVLGFFRPGSEVGVYGAVVSLTMLTMFVLNIITLLIPAVIASTHAKGEMVQLERLMRAAATASLLMALPLAVVYLFFGGPVLRLAFGPAFEAGALILAILTVGRTVSAACGSPGILLQMTGHHMLVTKITLVMAAITLAASVAVVGPYGPVGVAVVTAISMIARNLAMTVFARTRVGVLTLPSLRPRDIRSLLRFKASRRAEAPTGE